MPRSADEIVREIEKELKTSSRWLSADDWNRTHRAIAGLVDELRTGYPDDPRVVTYLPDRWMSLSLVEKRDKARAEVEQTLAATNDAGLKTSALYYRLLLRNPDKQVESSAAVSRAEAFARAAPGDNRAALILYGAAEILDEAWYVRMGIALVLAVLGGLTIAAARSPAISKARLRKVAIRLGLPTSLVLVALALAFQGLGEGGREALINTVLGFRDQAVGWFRSMLPLVSWIVQRSSARTWSEIRTIRAVLDNLNNDGSEGGLTRTGSHGTADEHQIGEGDKSEAHLRGGFQFLRHFPTFQRQARSPQ